MKLALTTIVLALATGAACAADKPKKGFDALDRNNDGYISRSEAAGDARLLKGFDVADKNNDGRIGRAEYMAARTKHAVRGAVNKPAEPDPGFNALDKDKDGYISKSEARGNPHLKKYFDRAAGSDGRVNRAEYLAEMAKKDVKSGAAKVEHSSTGR